MRRRLTALLAASTLLLTAVACDDETGSPGAAEPTPAPTSQAAQDMMALPPFGVVEPGTYWIDLDDDPSTPLRVTYEVGADGWVQWFGAVKFNEDGHTAVTITTVTNLVRDGCRDHSPAEPPVGPTVDDLAVALSNLVPFEVTAPPSDVTFLGYPGKHLELTVPDLPVASRGDDTDSTFVECSAGQLHSYFAAHDDDGAFYGYNGEPGRTEEFWILDVQGTRLVLTVNQSATSPPEDVAEARAILDSIRVD